MRAVLLGAVLGVLLGSSPSAALRGTSRGVPDHEALGQAWLSAHQLAPGAGLEVALEAAFVRLRLGSFDVRIDRAILSDEEAFEDLAQALGSLLSVEREWTAWNPIPAGLERELASLQKTLAGWCGGWAAKDLRKLDAAATDLLDALGAKDRVRSALQRLAELAAAREPRPPARVLLVPDRATFVGLACAIGVLREDLQPCFWVPGLAQWTQFEVEGTRVATFQFASPDASAPIEAGIPMDERNPRGLEQQIAYVGVAALLQRAFGERLDPVVAGGLVNNLLLDLYGELDTRIDGDVSSRTVQGRSMFIPGVRSDGRLPGANADSRWRHLRGRGYFLDVLRASKKSGAKLAPSRAERLLTFELQSADQSERVPVQAPFLGPAARGEVPAAVQGDYLEFLRAYRVAFLRWLRVEAGGRASATRFQELLAALRSEAEERDFPTLLRDVYGVPLSSSDPGEDDLEGRFLTWLAKGR